MNTPLLGQRHRPSTQTLTCRSLVAPGLVAGRPRPAGCSRASSFRATGPLHAGLTKRQPASRLGLLFQMAAASPDLTAPECDADDNAPSGICVEIDNTKDDECTLITVEGKDQSHLLVNLTSIFITAGLNVVSASITSEDGYIFDVFRVQNPDGGKLTEDGFDEIRARIAEVTTNTSRSGKPAIYGIVAACEVERLRPLTGEGAQSEVRVLELSAAEMAQAAAELVAREREILMLRDDANPDARAISLKETARTEAAAVLERKMAAMEAAMAARRTFSIADPQAPLGSMQDSSIDITKPVAGLAGCGSGAEILFQGFNWDSHKSNYYKDMVGKVKELAAAGISAVWLPPPSDAVSPQGYLPRDLYKLDSAYGTEVELRALLAELKAHNIKSIADIVINHRCAHTQGEDGKWNKFGGKMEWDATAICSNNPVFGGRGGRKRGDEYAAAPNIDHTQEFVRKDLTKWLKWLKDDIGYDGWRYDFVRGYEGGFAKVYNEETSPLMAFGEFWDSCEYTDGVLNYNQDAHRQRTINWCDGTDGTCAAFDFTTKGILQEAVGRKEYWRLVDAQGRPPGLLGLWPSRAITFIDNHDTGSTLNHWPFPNKNLPEGYAYILTHPGSPTVFYDHFWDDKNGLKKGIRELLALRRKHGINARSKVAVKKVTSDLYAATIDDKLAVKIGFGDWSPKGAGIKFNGKDLTLASSGYNYAVWAIQ